jgi:hypothetical protein
LGFACLWYGPGRSRKRRLSDAAYGTAGVTAAAALEAGGK